MAGSVASETRRRLLERLPDEPRWVETRGALICGDCLVLGSEGGCVVRSDGQRLLSIVGNPSERLLRTATAGLDGGWTLICAPEVGTVWRRSLPGWTLETAIVHSLPAGVRHCDAPPVEARIEEVNAAAPELVAHLREPLRREIAVVAGKKPLFVARVDGVAVSFCYAAFMTESLWDVSVDTLAGYRRQGLAAACCARAVESLARGGRRPVWGAVEANVASLGLARRLGFREVDRLAVLEGSL